MDNTLQNKEGEIIFIRICFVALLPFVAYATIIPLTPEESSVEKVEPRERQTAGRVVYGVIKFLPSANNAEEAFSVIPMGWMISEQACKWPPKDVKVVRSKIKNNVLPEPEWPTYLCVVMKCFTNYEDAMLYEIKLTELSESSSTEGAVEAIERVRLRRRKRTTANCCSTPPPSLPEIDEEDNHTSVADIDNIVDLEDELKNEEHILFEGDIPVISVDGDIAVGAVGEEILRKLNLMHLHMIKLDKKVDELLRLRYIRGTAPTSTDTSKFDELPLKSLNELHILEERLGSSEETRNELTNLLYLIGGSNPRKCTTYILARTFTNDVAALCSWTGAKNNFELQHLFLMKIIKNTVQKSHPSLKDMEFIEIVKDWFRHASQRVARSSKKLLASHNEN